MKIVLKTRTKIICLAGATTLLMLLVVVALPLWFPWILRATAGRFGANYARYERHGYGSFQIEGFSFTNDAGSFESKKVQAFVPTVWIFRRWFGPKTEPFLNIDSWKYVARDNGQPASLNNIFQKATAVAASLQRWIPSAKLSNGTIQVPLVNIKIPQASWVDGKLTAQATVSSNSAAWTIQANFEPQGLNLKLNCNVLDFHSGILIADARGKLKIESTAFWLTNRIELEAEFSDRGLLPQTAHVQADSFSIPARFFHLKQYDNLAGALRIDWNTNNFSIVLTAKASPQNANLPVLDVEARAAGDTNSAHIESLKITSPWFQAQLPGPVDISYRPPFVAQPLKLGVRADLEQQSFFRARGKMQGQMIFLPSSNAFPEIAFSLSGTNLAVTNLIAKSLQAGGTLSWPEIELANAKAITDDGTQISASGKFDFEKKAIQHGRLNFSGDWGGQFLPQGFSFESARVAAELDGPLATLTNSVKLTVKNALLPQTKPLDIQASWKAVGANATSARIAINAGASSLQWRGSGTIGRTSSVTVTELTLSRSNQNELRLQQPFEVKFSNAVENSWTLELSPVIWSGSNQEMRLNANVDWPRRGIFHVAGNALNSGLACDFLNSGDFQARIETLDLSGGWTNGPISFHLLTKSEATTKEQQPFWINVDVSGREDGLNLNQFFISSGTEIVARVQGSLPITLTPLATNGLLQVNPARPLNLKLFTEPDSLLWKKISDVTGLTIQRPDLSADLTGTWSAPQGRVNVNVERIQLPSGETKIPPLENLSVRAQFDRDRARISKCELFIDGQPVTLTGQVPLGQSYWSGLGRQNALPDWRKASAKLKIEKAKLQAFAGFLPAMLAPQGTINADISLEPGGNFGGSVSVSGARTWPLENIGPVRNINARAVLNGRTVTLAEASAEIGGQKINATGGLELNEQLWSTNGLPIFEVQLHGTNVPLARNSSILLRSDFDLAVTNAVSQPPLIRGTIILRDSLYLADLKSLAPEASISIARRPPYFSVNEEPWSSWRLNVAVQGSNSFRVQTPLFRGNISTRLQLAGTLKDPVALGEVKINSGTVTFPFGNLKVKQGFVTLTSQNPFHPQLYVTAEGQRFGYDLKMEVTGPADHPLIQLTSIPLLSYDQILLMLTTGQAPRNIGVTTGIGQQAEGLALFVGKNLLSDFGFGGNGEDRLTFNSGEQISENGHATYDIEYKLNDYWSVIGQYDRFDQYNLNLKWRVYSK